MALYLVNSVNESLRVCSFINEFLIICICYAFYFLYRSVLTLLKSKRA